MPRANHKVKAGYPAKVYFDTREALTQYLAGDKITCLLCGNQFQLLDTHLRSMHGITGEDYREKYGIPYQQALCPTERSERDRQRMIAYLAADPEERARRAAFIKVARWDPSDKRVRKKPALWKNERTKYPLELWYEFGRRVAAGRFIEDVGRDSDMPLWGGQGIHWARKRHPEFGKWWDANVEPVRRDGAGYNLSAAGRAKRAEQNKAEP